MRPLLVFKHSYRMDEFQLQERTNLAMDGQLCRRLWNGVSSPHDQETPYRSFISARSRKSTYEKSSLVWFVNGISFCFLTLFWFYCLCCFMGWLTIYKILKFGLVWFTM
jgi:hypothetical protein